MSTLTPSRFDAFHEESSFQLPMPGLFGDVDSGDASVGMGDDFLDLPPDTRARMIQHWMQQLRALKDAAVVEMFRSSRSARRGTTIIEQLGLFREECRGDGITVPADLPVLLQRY